MPARPEPGRRPGWLQPEAARADDPRTAPPRRRRAGHLRRTRRSGSPQHPARSRGSARPVRRRASRSPPLSPRLRRGKRSALGCSAGRGWPGRLRADRRSRPPPLPAPERRRGGAARGPVPGSRHTARRAPRRRDRGHRALISTPASAGPTSAPTPSHQLVAMLAEVSSSGWRTTSGISTWCSGRLTPSDTRERHCGDVHDGHWRTGEDRHAAAAERHRCRGVGAGEQSGDADVRQPGADQRGEEHRRDQLQDHHQARRRGAAANVCVDDHGEPLTELGYDHRQVGE